VDFSFYGSSKNEIKRKFFPAILHPERVSLNQLLHPERVSLNQLSFADDLNLNFL